MLSKQGRNYALDTARFPALSPTTEMRQALVHLFRASSHDCFRSVAAIYDDM